MTSPSYIHDDQLLEEFGYWPGVRRPLKVVFLGAGSFFLQFLLPDLLNIPGADQGELALVDIDQRRLDLAERFSRKNIETIGRPWTVTASTDRRKVLAGAHYVVNCIEVSGVDCVTHDNDIPLKYGVDQCIGDTVGPGGLFKALRTVPVFIQVLKDMEELCPKAWMLNYTNPMSIMCLAARRASSTPVVGLCHSVQGTSHQLRNYLEIPYGELQWKCGGINHLSWFTELTRDGVDQYPVLRKRLKTDPDLLAKDPIRFDMMQYFGYFITESSGHLSEYVPYYRKRKDLIAKHTGKAYNGETSFYRNVWPESRVNFDKGRERVIAGEDPVRTTRSVEYASYIIEAMETNSPFMIHGNMPNTGLIENLPQDGIVEVACLVNRNGIQPTHFGPLPRQCAAVCDWNMRMYDLAAEACLHKSMKAAFHALLLDPLTAAVLSPGEIEQMTREMFEAEKDYLPGFEWK